MQLFRVIVVVFVQVQSHLMDGYMCLCVCLQKFIL